MLPAIWGALASTVGCAGQTSTDASRLPRQPITSIDCTPEQKGAVEEAFEGICKAVAEANGPCETVLRQHDVLESFQRQCGRGLTVRCRETLCGQYVPKRVAFYTDDGTIEIGSGGLAGGRGCGGYENPMDGPAHTLTHEMAHAAHLVTDGLAERVAYACRADQ
jgi:hypothetical protein